MFPNAHLSNSFHKFYCQCCAFKTMRKSQFDTHCLTAKHKILTNPNDPPNETLSKIEKDISCKCGKKYKHMSSLCAHKKICTYQNIITEKKKSEHELTSDQNNIFETDETKPLPTQSDPINTDLIIELLKQNQEFKSLLAEQNKHMVDQNKHMLELMEKGIGNITNNNNISNNITKNKFNLNIFLNEQCKDAMNIMDFVNSLQLKLSDLERVGELGYVKGISHIIVNKLKDLDICMRPMHCSDLKRETMYVKDENSWEKENGKNEKITKMIKHVAHKNQLQINEWRQENPEHKNPESTKCDKFLAIVNQSMGGSTADDDINNYNKIIKNIAKEVIIDKEPE